MKQEYALILAQLQLIEEPTIDVSDVTRGSLVNTNPTTPDGRLCSQDTPSTQRK